MWWVRKGSARQSTGSIIHAGSQSGKPERPLTGSRRDVSVRTRLLQCVCHQSLILCWGTKRDMSDHDRAREREHWQAIAEQLGLAPEAETREVAHAMPAARLAEKAPEPEPIAPPEPEQDEGPRLESPVATDQTEPEPSVARSDEAAEEPTDLPSSEPADTEEKPEPRGRRRRRSTSRSDKARTTEPSEAGNVENREASPKRREKGRGRKKQAQAAAGEGAGAPVASIAEPDDADDDEGYGNWTVPSWSELIASLYRPER